LSGGFIVGLSSVVSLGSSRAVFAVFISTVLAFAFWNVKNG